MLNSFPKKIIKMKRWTAEQMATRIGLLIAVTLVLLGGIGAVWFQSSLRESQETRRDASVDQGQVEVRVVPTFALLPGQPAVFEFQVNTHGVQTDGVQLVFNIVRNTNATGSLVTPYLETTSGLQTAYSEVEATGDGFLVGLIAIPTTVGSGYSTNDFTTFARLSFSELPNEGGYLQFIFDQENSLSTVRNTNPPQDELSTLPSPTFTFTTSGDPSPSPTATPHGDPSPSPTATPVSTATPTPNPTATPISGEGLDDFYFPSLNDQNAVFWFYEVGTRNGVSSNQLVPGRNYTVELPYVVQNVLKTYQNRADGVFLRLYQNGNQIGQVVLGYNDIRNNAAGARGTFSGTFTAQTNNILRFTVDPTSAWQESNETNNSFERTFSYNTGLGGISYLSCNESCSSNTQCGPNYRCYQNRCRLAINPSSESCSTTITSVPSNTTVTAACNASCDANNDCAVNYRCYSGRCRLATNPTSATCNAATSSTVSTIYSSPTKGGLGSNNNSTTSSATSTPKPASVVKPSTSPGASASGMPRATGNPVEEQPKDIGGWFSGLFTNALSFPTILVASGIGLLILIILISLILAATRRRKQSSPVVPNRPQTATYERSLQQRITELQANKSGATPASTTPIRPITPTAPVAPAAQPQTPMVSSTTPMTPPPSTRQPMSTTPMPGADSQAKPVSVLDRMKQKGITTPGSS